MRTIFVRTLLPLLLLLTLSAAARAQFTYQSNNGQITITGFDCSSAGGAVAVPSAIDGLPVTSIGGFAFARCISMTSVSIPESVTRIGGGGLSGCTSLTGVYFAGNAPSAGQDVFSNTSTAIVHYLPGTTGWGSMFAGRPTVLWNPRR